MRTVWLLTLALLLPATAFAQELAPGTRYDPAIPTLESVVGHDHGDELTTSEEAGIYLRALAEAAPDRAYLVEYATSWEGRTLYLMAIGSPARIGALDETKAGLRQLGDPRGLSADEVDALVADMPVVTWLVHGVHGNEISSTDASMAEAYHLLAAQGDESVDRILRESIVLIDPMENPDGRARFIHQHLLGRAASPDPEPVSAEHDEPWPGGRGNHYLFDINRDWFAQTQPETRGRIGIYLDWMPHVVVDLHEMGGNSTYFFAPPTRPLNPRLSASQNEWLDAFGRANAARFDQRGFAYFIRESYDLFYPGYGDSWPSMQGAIGMTYEQASARGLVFRRSDDTHLSYKNGVVHHFTAAIATADTAARNRVGILRDFAQHRRGVEGGDVAEYLLPPANDIGRTTRLGRFLAAQGIEVGVADAPVTVGDRTLPAGTLVVPLAQPAGRLAATLLDAETPMDAAFLEEQDRRRQRRENDQIYDITGWSLPLVFDVEAIASVSATGAVTSPLPAPGGDTRTLAAAQVAYLMPWGLDTAAAVVEALGSGIRVRSADDGFTMEGREYSAGTAIIRSSENDSDLASRLGEIAGRHGAEVVPTDTGWVDDGIALGSNRVRALKAPRILMAWDTPTSSQSAGFARYVLERRYGQPVTVVRTGSLGRVDLSRYDVLVLPSGDYGRVLTGGTLDRIKGWVRGGATLVTIGEASRWAARESAGLVATTTELRDGSAEVEDDDDDEDDESNGSPDPDGDEPFDLETAITPDRELPESIPGALLRVTLDPKHWLSAGSDGEIQAVVEGRRVFTPITLDDGVNVGVYAPKDRLVASGLAWENSQDLIAQKAFLIHQPMGQGHVIAFAEDPNFRAFAETTQLLFMNAVLLGPAH